MKSIKFFITPICILFLLLSCTFTTTKTKNPTFIDQAKVENELLSLVTSENINLNGQEITKNKKATSELEISITNGKNIPIDDNGIKSLGKSIASCIKRNLKDANQFDIYKVLFVTKEEKGGVTKSKWTGNVFSVAEL